jgi:3-methyladenine DNA glycosylase AlkD
VTSVIEISAQIRALASPETASVSQRFFKTGKGQYGEGDIFLGIKVPHLRSLAKQCRDTKLDAIGALLKSRYHEERLVALLLLMQFYAKGNADEQDAAYTLYLDNTRHINNWDLVDISAPHIVGKHLAQRTRDILYELARSANLWERRIAIIATFHFIRLNEFNDTLRIAEILLRDDHDLMHKAVGWMLREVGKRDNTKEADFLRLHYREMPRTMLRYAIERFPEPLRKQYLQGTI